MLKFQKLLDSKSEIQYDWMLVLDSHSSVMNYHEQSMKSEVHKAWENLVLVAQGRSHINNVLARIINLKLNIETKSIFEQTVDIIDKLLKDKLECVDKYGAIYINKRGGYFTHHSDLIVTEECFVENDNVIFPQYTEKDIRTTKWEEGKHFYAYVGSFQVVSNDGTKKWNTEKDAYREAKYFLDRLNRKQFELKN